MPAKFPSSQGITLSWCGKHGEWFVQNCPDCMSETVQADYEAQLKAIKIDCQNLVSENSDLISQVKERTA